MSSVQPTCPATSAISGSHNMLCPASNSPSDWAAALGGKTVVPNWDGMTDVQAASSSVPNVANHARGTGSEKASSSQDLATHLQPTDHIVIKPSQQGRGRLDPYLRKCLSTALLQASVQPEQLSNSQLIEGTCCLGTLGRIRELAAHEHSFFAIVLGLGAETLQRCTPFDRYSRAWQA